MAAVSRHVAGGGDVSAGLVIGALAWPGGGDARLVVRGRFMAMAFLVNGLVGLGERTARAQVSIGSAIKVQPSISPA